MTGVKKIFVSAAIAVMMMPGMLSAQLRFENQDVSIISKLPTQYTGYVIHGSTGSTTVYYRVSAVVVGVGETKSNVITVADANAVRSSTNIVQLGWLPVEGATSYNIYRSTVSASTYFFLLRNVDKTILYYKDTGAANTSAYSAPNPRGGNLAVENNATVGGNLDVTGTFTAPSLTAVASRLTAAEAKSSTAAYLGNAQTFTAAQTMSGPLTVASSVTVTGDAFSVGGSSFAVSYGNIAIGSDTISGVDLSLYGGSTVASAADFQTVSMGFKALGKTAKGRIYSSLNSVLLTNNMDYNGSDYVSNRDDISLNGSMIELGQDGISLWPIPSGANPINAGGGDFALLGNAYFRMNNERAYWMNAEVGIGTATPTAILEVKGASAAGVDSTYKGIFRVVGTDGVGLAISEYNSSPWGMSLQAIDNRSGNGSFYSISINPQGGNVGIATTNPTETLEVVGGIASYSRTMAQLLAITPSQVGVQYFCNNCTPAKMVVSTGTAAGNFAGIMGGTFE